MLTADKVRAALEELSPTQEKVDLAVMTAVEIAQPSRVILFGFWPRGEAKWDSDVDMAVLMPDSAESLLGAIYRSIRAKLREIPMSIDLVVTTEGCAGQFLGSINSIYHRILTQGRVAYDQQPAHTGADTSYQCRIGRGCSSIRRHCEFNPRLSCAASRRKAHQGVTGVFVGSVRTDP